MLQAWANPGGMPPDVRMMLANDELRVVLVTIHQSLRSAIEAITFERVLQTIVITHAALRAWGLDQPRLSVAGLNPHAGEGGLFGREEVEVIAPAIAAARSEIVIANAYFLPGRRLRRALVLAAQRGVRPMCPLPGRTETPPASAAPAA